MSEIEVSEIEVFACALLASSHKAFTKHKRKLDMLEEGASSRPAKMQRVETVCQTQVFNIALLGKKKKSLSFVKLTIITLSYGLW